MSPARTARESALERDGSAAPEVERAEKPSVFLVGNHLSSSLGTRSVAEDLAIRLEAEGFRVISASDRRNRLARLLDMTLTAHFRRREFDIALVDLFSGAAFLWAEAVCFVLRRAGKPYVLNLHGGALPEFARRWPRRFRKLLDSASAITAPSAYLPERLRLPEGRCQLVQNPLSIERYPFRLRERPRANLLWLRAFHEIYNPALALRAFHLLVREFPEARLVMVGPDKRDGTLESARALAKSLGIEERVRWAGAVPKASVPEALKDADIFLNTSNVDNTPVTVLEALASGLCVVSTDVGGIPYLLEHERDSLLVPPNDPESMASAARRLLQEPGLASRISRNGRSKASRCDWSHVLPRWEAVIRASRHE